MTRWRNRIGEEGLEWMLTQAIKAAESTKVVKPQSYQKIIVDSTVQEKAIAYPTDSKLLERARQHLVKLAAEAGLTLRQNYNREAPQLAVQVGRYAHAKQYKRMRASLKKLKTVVGRVWRDVARQRENIAGALQDKATDLLAKAKRLLTQKQRDKNKLYSLHAPKAECIAKGKTRQPYEFGVKVSIATTHREGLVVGMRSMPGNPYDGHTLYETLEQGDPHRAPAQRSVCGPRLSRRRGASRNQGLPPQTQARYHRTPAARHPTSQRHRAGDRTHEERRQAAAKLAQRRGRRCLPRATVRLRPQPTHDPAEAAASFCLDPAWTIWRQLFCIQYPQPVAPSCG
ncbi:IS5 family transposase [Rugamonas sp.]|uniref:IS5 family transposase n=1 Tax=Rugamonas sp. TaxID=1926287 RepID=UPI0025DEFA76|nr:IS5 family transposase [Rugamonas sp.]